MCNSDFITRSAIIGVFLIDVSALYQPIHALKWKTHNLTHRRFFRDNDDSKENNVLSAVHILSLRANLSFNLSLPNPLSFLQNLSPFFNVFTIFFHNRFLLPPLWSSALTLKVPYKLFPTVLSIPIIAFISYKSHLSSLSLPPTLDIRTVCLDVSRYSVKMLIAFLASTARMSVLTVCLAVILYCTSSFRERFLRQLDSLSSFLSSLSNCLNWPSGCLDWRATIIECKIFRE